MRTLPSYVCKREAAADALRAPFPTTSTSTSLRTRDEADFPSSCLYRASREFLDSLGADSGDHQGLGGPDAAGRSSVVYLSTGFRLRIARSLTQPSPIVAVDGREPSAFPLFKRVEEHDDDALFAGVLGGLADPRARSAQRGPTTNEEEGAIPRQFRFPIQRAAPRRERRADRPTPAAAGANPFAAFARDAAVAAPPSRPDAGGHADAPAEEDPFLAEDVDFMAGITEWWDSPHFDDVERSFADMVTGNPDFAIGARA